MLKPVDSNDEVKALVKAIALEGQNLDSNDPNSNQALLTKARALVSALESPLETIFGFTMGEPPRLFASRMALDLKFFDTLAADNGRPKTSQELAAPCDASLKLTRRLMRTLCAFNVVDQVGDDEYAQNRISRYLAFPMYRGGICFAFDAIGPTLHKTPEFLKKERYQNPDGNNTPFRYSHDGQDKWTWIEKHPEVFRAFQDYLNGVREDTPGFEDEGFYPVKERLINGLVLDDSPASAFIDVGGGNGGTLVEFQRKTQWPGRLVLQEQESVIQLAKSQPHASMFEPTVHDFFTPQPLHGPRVFYMRYILHDWPDEDCKRILRPLKDAMTPGYSKILIHDCVVADRDPDWQHTCLDMIMMSMYGGQERTESEWRELIESVGLQIAGIWTKGVGNLSVIEVVLPVET